MTASGRYVDLLDPRPDDITIEDIAGALARQCRFGGHAAGFYSVAQHCVLVHDLVSPQAHQDQARAHALLHDAHEAYTGDITRPVSLALATLAGGDAVATLRDLVDRAVHKAFGLAWPPPPAIAAEIEAADLTALATERRDLMPADDPTTAPPPFAWPDTTPHPDSIHPLPWQHAEQLFLDRFAQLGLPR